MRKILFVVLFFNFVGGASAEIYKWRDENGTLHFSDAPVTNQEVEIHVMPKGNSFEAVELKFTQTEQEVRNKQDHVIVNKEGPPAGNGREVKKLDDWTPEDWKRWEEEVKKRPKTEEEKERDRKRRARDRLYEKRIDKMTPR